MTRLKQLLNEPRLQFEVIKRSPGHLGTRPETAYFAYAASLAQAEPGALVTPFLFPASSDGNAFRRDGHAVYGLVPCKLAKSEVEAVHGVNERIRDVSLEQGTRVIVQTMLRLARPVPVR